MKVKPSEVARSRKNFSRNVAEKLMLCRLSKKPRDVSGFCRSASRYGYDPDDQNNELGFRAVLAPGQ